MNEEAKLLAEELSTYREAYYNLEPIVPDDVYDKKRDRLKQLCPEHFEVKAVGAHPSVLSIWEKVQHEIPMGSLDKVKSHEEFDKWVAKIGMTDQSDFAITHKIDGASLELIYQKGELVRGVTRGDGYIGEDITCNIKNIASIPQKLSIDNKLQPINATVRGEIVMLKEIFDQKYADKYANPRNTASSKMREKKNKGSACKDMEFLAYWIKSNDKIDSMELMFTYLKQIGFQTPPICQGPVKIIKENFIHTAINRASLPYEIDGVVISVASIPLLEELGDVSMRPRGQIAWKFESEKAESRILDVVWQVGLTGRVCPVAKIEPTKIGGVTIESVSLHNLKMFKELKLFRGCRVLIERRNDCIPYLAENLDSE
jgi:DNA ligase (NAD+)